MRYWLEDMIERLINRITPVQYATTTAASMAMVASVAAFFYGWLSVPAAASVLAVAAHVGFVCIIAPLLRLNGQLGHAETATRVLAVLAPEGEDVVTAWKRSKDLGRLLMYEYELVQLTGTAADTFATRHGFAAAVQHKPAAIVLDQGGSALAQLLPSLVTAEPATFAAALKGFSCAPVDAEAKLAAALADAKETGRNVFVRFDAPW